MDRGRRETPMAAFTYVTVQNAPRIKDGGRVPRTPDGWGLFPYALNSWITTEALRRLRQTRRWAEKLPVASEPAKLVGSVVTVTDMDTMADHETAYTPWEIGPERGFYTCSESLLVVLGDPEEPFENLWVVADIFRRETGLREADLVSATIPWDVEGTDRVETALVRLVRRYATEYRWAKVFLLGVGAACLALARIVDVCLPLLREHFLTTIYMHGDFWPSSDSSTEEVALLRRLDYVESHRSYFIITKDAISYGVHPGLPFLPQGAYHAIAQPTYAERFISAELATLLGEAFRGHDSSACPPVRASSRSK